MADVSLAPMQENIHFPPVSAWLEKQHFWRLLPVHRRLPLSLCFPVFLSLPFSFLLCCVLTCIWDPYSPSCLDQSVMLKSLPQELWGICPACEWGGPAPDVMCTRFDPGTRGGRLPSVPKESLWMPGALSAASTVLVQIPLLCTAPQNSSGLLPAKTKYTS